MTTNDDRAEQIRARLSAATPGPWEAWRNKEAEPEVSQQGRGYMGLVATPSHRPADYGRSNADLIANAPADLAFLLAERTELLRRVEQAEALEFVIRRQRDEARAEQERAEDERDDLLASLEDVRRHRDNLRSTALMLGDAAVAITQRAEKAEAQVEQAERAGAVKALEGEAQRFENGHVLDGLWGQRGANALWVRASEVKNGADL